MEYIWCCISSVQQSTIYIFHNQPAALCFYIYYTEFLKFAIPKCFNTYKYTMMWQSNTKTQTQQNFIMFIIVLGQNISILIESSSGSSKNTEP